MRFIYHRALVLTASIALASNAAWTQGVTNSFDFEMTPRFLQNQGTLARMVDMAYTESGDLIVAFVENANSYNDQVVIMRRGTSGVWSTIANHPTMFHDVVELSMTVPEGGDGGNPDRDRVYIALHLANYMSNGTIIERAALMSAPWNDGLVAPDITYMPGLSMQAGRPLQAWSPGVACVPTEHRDFTDYVVEFVFAYPDALPAGGASIYRSRSNDFGENLLEPQAIAGISSSGELSSMEYGMPSVCADADFARVVIAVEDRDLGIVQVLAGTSNDDNLELIRTTPGEFQGQTQIERDPIVAAFDGVVMLSFIGADKSGGGWQRLHLVQGVSIEANGNISRIIHPRTATPGDIAMRNEGVYVAARIFPDNVMPQQDILAGWSGGMDAVGNWSGSLADHNCRARQPRVAVTQGSSPVMQSVGYSSWDGYVDPYGTWFIGSGYINLDL